MRDNFARLREKEEKSPCRAHPARRLAAREVYGFDLIVLRPDLHIVWRGNLLPADAAEIAAVATGH